MAPCLQRLQSILEFPDATIRLRNVIRLSNRGRYALKAAFDLAAHADAPVQVRDVASRQRIPLRFLEQIFQLMKRGGLVESKRGPRGGFRLTRQPDEVKLGDVLRAVEGPVVLGGQTSRRRIEADVTEAVLVDLSRSVESCFDSLTLEDLRARQDRTRLGSRAAQSPSYVI